MLDGAVYVFTLIAVEITFDPPKRLSTLSERGIHFAVDAEKVFAGRTQTFLDQRFGYGETRLITVGWLDERMVWSGPNAIRRATSFR